ncbi:fungal-specific transcription factor domain-containing protein [Mycena vitilis]|nr:fungal-specific transcription factor domain-containing protein [Mycena vitilis]
MSWREMTGEERQRKSKRACDVCRRRKRRCDGGDRCSMCIKTKSACTYLGPAAMRGAAWSRVDGSWNTPGDDYVEDLKLRLESAEAAIQPPAPGQPSMYIRAIRLIAKPFTPPHLDDAEFIEIADSFRTLSLESQHDPGFQGKFGAGMFVKAAVAVAVKCVGGPLRMPCGSAFGSAECTCPKPDILVGSSFPDDALLEMLVSLYFSNINPLIPVLHRPTFEQSIIRRLHMYEIGSATILLLVCALGSLYLPQCTYSKDECLTLGWKWYNQVELSGHLLRQVAVHDIQAYCLAVQFLVCTSNPRFAWSIAGFGCRLAQDLGSHRNKTWGPTITIQDDLEKRACWILAFLDVQLSASLGRSPHLDPIEMDVTLPAECDDEHWQPWGLGFQPKNTPSSLAFFNCLVNLYRILHFVLRTFYSTRLNHVRYQRLDDLNKLTPELELALGKWFSSIPQHLIWSPDDVDGLFFDQSAALYVCYCYTRTLIHRPFIPGLSSLMDSNSDALGICAEASRACILALDIHHRRRPNNPLIFSQVPLFTAATMLMLNKWSGNDELIELVSYTSIRILEAQQERWPSSEYLRTVLEGLIALDEEDPTEQTIESSTTEDPLLPAKAPDLGPAIRVAPAGVLPEAEPPLVPANPYVWRQKVSIPPAFIGDEEITRKRMVRPPMISDFVDL